MSTPASPMELLEAVAPDFGATLDAGASPPIARVPVVRASGRRHEFVLQLSVTGDTVQAREAPPGDLPRFCPDRHINGDRTFCLGWGPTSPSTVRDETSARAWWSAVLRFLRLQVTASETRRWVNGSNDWAHGDAAQHQARAEAAAEALGPRFLNDLQRGAFSVLREPHARGARIALRRRGAHIARVVLGPPTRIKDGQVACPCELTENRAVAECCDHVEHLTTFIAELWNWRRKEAAFARELVRAGVECCGTLENCTLRNAMMEVGSQKRTKERNVRRHRPSRRPRF